MDPQQGPWLVLVGTLIPKGLTPPGQPRQLIEHEHDLIDVPRGLAGILSHLQRPQTLAEAQEWLLSKRVYDDQVLRELVIQGRLRLLHEPTAMGMIDQLHGLTLGLLGAWSRDETLITPRLGATWGYPASKSLRRLLDESVGGEDIPMAVRRLRLDAQDILTDLDDVLAARFVRLEKTHD